LFSLADLQREAGFLLPVALNTGSVLGVAHYTAIFTRHIPGSVLFIQSHVTDSSQKTALLNHGFSQAFLGASTVMLIVAVVA